MYCKVKNKERLLSGRTGTFLAKEFGFTKTHVYSILNGKQRIKKHLAYLLLGINNQYDFDNCFEIVE